MCGFDKGAAFVLDDVRGAGVGHFGGWVVAECAVKVVALVDVLCILRVSVDLGGEEEGIGTDGNRGLGYMAVIQDDAKWSCEKPVITRVLDLALQTEISVNHSRNNRKKIRYLQVNARIDTRNGDMGDLHIEPQHRYRNLVLYTVRRDRRFASDQMGDRDGGASRPRRMEDAWFAGAAPAVSETSLGPSRDDMS